jgi:hypothetical protein
MPAEKNSTPLNELGRGWVTDDSMAPLLQPGQLINFRRQTFTDTLLTSLAGEIVAFRLADPGQNMYSETYFGVVTERALAEAEPTLKIETVRPGFLGRIFYILEKDIFTIGPVNLEVPKRQIQKYIPNAALAKQKVTQEKLPQKPWKELLFRYRFG